MSLCICGHHRLDHESGFMFCMALVPDGEGFHGGPTCNCLEFYADMAPSVSDEGADTDG